MGHVSADLVDAARIHDAAVEVFGALDLSNLTDGDVGAASKANRELKTMVKEIRRLDIDMTAIADMADAVERMHRAVARAVSAALGF
jgi:hypothetical protein